MVYAKNPARRFHGSALRQVLSERDDREKAGNRKPQQLVLRRL